MKQAIQLSIAGQTRQGANRSQNDDRFLIRKLGTQSLLAAVADGPGGHPAGCRAADILMEIFTTADCTAPDIEESLKTVVYKADKK